MSLHPPSEVSDSASALTCRYYEEHAAEFCRETVNLDLGHLYSHFLSRISARGHILDAGCGSGRDSLFFRQQGFRVTACDASAAMVVEASKRLGQPVLLLSFQELAFEQEFDGIWACASLLHVPKAEMPRALGRLAAALRTCGVLYASFKLGEDEEIRRGRLFNSYGEQSFQELIASIPALQVLKMWRTQDARPEREAETWLNALLRKHG